MRKLVIIAAGVAVLGAPVCVCGTPPFGALPDWESVDARDTHEMALNDFDGDGWQNTVGERKKGDGQRHLFYVKHWPILTINAIRVNGTPVARADYCFDPRAGWFSLKNAPANGANVDVDYTWSKSLDFFAGNCPKPQATAHDVVYFNDNGKLGKNPGWISRNQDEVFAVAAADFDADGDVDVAIGGVNYGEYGHLKIYMNNGKGLETSPSWVYKPEPGIYFAPACLAWGDVDDDGYFELAVADAGEHAEASFRVFKNNGGTLESAPSWKVAGVLPIHVEWGDPDGDGDMDLACADVEHVWQKNGYTYIFRNSGGTLGTAPWWRNAPPVGRCDALAWGDVNGDGWLDFVKGVSGSGIIGDDNYSDIFLSNNGVLPTEPDWESELRKLVNTSVLADFTGDGRLDLVQAGGAATVFHPSGPGGFDGLPSWEHWPQGFFSTYDARVGDVNGDGLPDLAIAGGAVSDAPFGAPNWVFLNKGNIGINVRNFAASACARGVALRWGVNEAVAGFNLYREVKSAEAASEPRKANEELITGRSPYRYLDADVAVGNTYCYWLDVVPLAGPTERYGPVECTAGVKASFALAQNAPNPARTTTTFAFSVPVACDAALTVYDIAGRKVATPFAGAAKAGANELTVDVSTLVPGVYTYRLEAGGATAAKRMVVVR